MEVAMRMCRVVNSCAYRIAKIKDSYKPDKENSDRKLTMEEKWARRSHYRPIDLEDGEASFPKSVVEGTLIEYELQQIVLPIMKTCAMNLESFDEEVAKWEAEWWSENFMDILIRTPEERRMYLNIRRMMPAFESEKSKKEPEFTTCDFPAAPCQEYKTASGFMQTSLPFHMNTINGIDPHPLYYPQYFAFHKMNSYNEDPSMYQATAWALNAYKKWTASQNITQMTADIANHIKMCETNMPKEMVESTMKALAVLNGVRVYLTAQTEEELTDPFIEDDSDQDCSLTKEVLDLNTMKHSQTFLINGKKVNNDMPFKHAFAQLDTTTYLSDMMKCVLNTMKGHFCIIDSYITSYRHPLFKKWSTYPYFLVSHMVCSSQSLSGTEFSLQNRSSVTSLHFSTPPS